MTLVTSTLSFTLNTMVHLIDSDEVVSLGDKKRNISHSSASKPFIVCMAAENHLELLLLANIYHTP